MINIILWKYNNATNQYEKYQYLNGIHTRTVRRVAWSPDGLKLASAGFDGIIAIWSNEEDNNEWDCIAQLEGHENEVKCSMVTIR